MMEAGNEREAEKSSSSGTASGAKEPTTNPSSTQAQSHWNVMSVRSKVSDKCFWSACRAMTAGAFLIAIGAGMATVGFYSDYLSMEKQGNSTVLVKNETKDYHLSSLTYLGPVVMGIGGFTIVAACVMTFEARDTAAKIVPVWFRRTRIHVVSGGSGSTPSGRSSKASWERFLSQQRTSEDAGDTRSAITQALVNFSKYLQNSVDTNKISIRDPEISGQQSISLRKCPSEPSLAKMQRDANGNNVLDSIALLESSTPQPSQRATYGRGLKNVTLASKPQLLSVAPDMYRQVVSMDCPRSSRLQRQDTNSNKTNDNSSNSEVLAAERHTGVHIPLQTSCATSSSGSMSVDIYLPQGAVTLKVRDDMRDIKRLSAKMDDSEDSHEAKFIVQSDIRSFEDDDEYLPSECDDNVFINQDPSKCAPQIILNTSQLGNSYQDTSKSSVDNQNQLPSFDENLKVEEWASYPSAYSGFRNISDSLEVNTPDDSIRSNSTSTQFSFENSEKDSARASITSVISNPFSSRVGTQGSFSQTDSFMNVSPLCSMDSSQDVFSPSPLCSSPQYFQVESSDQSGVGKPFASERTISETDEYLEEFESIAKSPKNSAPENKEDLLAAESKAKATGQRKHNSLESAEIESSKARSCTSGSPKRQQFSLESSECRNSCDLPSRFLSPSTVSGLISPTPLSPTALCASPRKVRSESLPERRPSLKRFPLLRQIALDAFAEEAGSTHRLDRSQTQISPKEAFFPES